jgi:hypothetical protein
MSILVLTSDTLIGTAAAGNIEYNGQFFGTDSNASRAQLQRITSGTAVASTSGTSIDFTSIPSWIKRITVMFNAVSTNGSSNLMVQVGSSSISTSGYVSSGWTTNTNNVNSTAGLLVTGTNSSTYAWSGIAQICLLSSNTWAFSSSTSYQATSAMSIGAGLSPALGGALDRIRITTVNGTDTFDAGSVNIMYEG